jgi:drug/metabolite transporter (DMT)-like permease
MLAAVSTLIFIALATRELSRDLSVVQILFLRSAVGFPFLLVGVWALMGRDGLRQFRTGNLRLQYLRNGMQMVAQSCWIYAVGVLPFATVFAIEYSQPLWAVLLGSLFLSEHPTRWQKIGLAIGFVGVLMITRPGGEAFSWAIAIMTGASVLYAGIYLTTRVLGRSDSALALPFWTCAIQIPITLAIAVFDWRDIREEHIGWILLLGLGGLAQQFCIGAALRLAPMARVIPIDYLRLPVIAIIGTVFYAELVDPIAMVGAVIVIAGVLLTQRSQSR